MDPILGHVSGICHTMEPSPELLAWPASLGQGPEKDVPCKGPPTGLPLGLMIKAVPKTKPGLLFYGPPEKKDPPLRTTATPAKSIPSSADVESTALTTPPLPHSGPGWRLYLYTPPVPPAVPLRMPNASVKAPPAALSQPKAHTQLLPLCKCGVDCTARLAEWDATTSGSGLDLLDL